METYFSNFQVNQFILGTTGIGLYALMLKSISLLILSSAAALFSLSVWNTLFYFLSL